MKKKCLIFAAVILCLVTCACSDNEIASAVNENASQTTETVKAVSTVEPANTAPSESIAVIYATLAEYTGTGTAADENIEKNEDYIYLRDNGFIGLI